MKRNRAPNFNTNEGMITYWKRRLYEAKQSKNSERESMIQLAEQNLLKYKDSNETS